MPKRNDKQRKAMFAAMNSVGGSKGLSPKLRKTSFDQLQKKDFNQLKKLGIKLNPKGDIDNDGVKNMKDCKPLNPNKQGFLHELRIKMLKKKEEKLEEKRRVQQKKLEDIRETLSEKNKISQSKLDITKAHQAQKQVVIDEINKEKQVIKDLKAANKAAKKEIFRQSATGKVFAGTSKISKATLAATDRFFASPGAQKAGRIIRKGAKNAFRKLQESNREPTPRRSRSKKRRIKRKSDPNDINVDDFI